MFKYALPHYALKTVQSLQDSMTTYSDKDQEQHSHQNYRNIILLR